MALYETNDAGTETTPPEIPQLDLLTKLHNLYRSRRDFLPMETLDQLAGIMGDHAGQILDREHFEALGRILTTWTLGERTTLNQNRNEGDPLEVAWTTIERIPDITEPPKSSLGLLQPPGALISVERPKGKQPNAILLSKRPIQGSDILGIIGVERHFTPRADTYLPPPSNIAPAKPRKRAKTPQEAEPFEGRPLDEIERELDFSRPARLFLSGAESAALQYIGLPYPKIRELTDYTPTTLVTSLSTAKAKHSASKSQLVAAAVRLGKVDKSRIKDISLDPATLTELNRKVLKSLLLTKKDAAVYLQTHPDWVNVWRDEMLGALRIEDPLEAFVAAVDKGII